MSNKYPFTLRMVRSDGAELVLGDGSEWVLSMNDMGDWIPMDIRVDTSANVLTDGSTLVSKRVGEKDRTCRAVYWGTDRQSARANAIAFFNPKHSFEAHLTYFGRTRWCEGELIAFDCPISDERTPTQVTFTMLCTDPYLRSESHNEAAFGDAHPMFGWPFVSHTRMALPDGTKHPVGFLFGKLIYDGENTVWNNGDVPTLYTVRIEAEADLVNPTITKDGRFVKMLDTLHAGDVVEIDFESTPPKMTKNGINAITLASRDSSFSDMQMQVGANVFAFSCDNAENRSLAKVQVLFYRKYLGV